MELSETQAETTLVYTAKAHIAGKLARLGQRLAAGWAKKTADEFFKNSAVAVSGETIEGYRF